MKRLLTAIACIFIVSPTYAQVESAGDLRDSCSALVAISKGSQSPATAGKARLCLWVFSTAAMTFNHMKLAAAQKSGQSPLASCREPAPIEAIEAWLAGPAKALEPSDGIAIASTSVAQFYMGQCKKFM